MSWLWHDRDLDQLAILARDFTRSNRMKTLDDLKAEQTHPFVNFNSWQGHNAAQWWAIGHAAAARYDLITRDEAYSIARSLQESDDLTARFESLPIIQRYRAAVKREQGHP